MAVKKVEKEENTNTKLENNNKNIDETNTKVEEENTLLRNELSEMKEMLQQLMKAQSKTVEESPAPQTKSSDMFDMDEELDIIPLNKLINVTSLFNGILTLKGANDASMKFNNFGITLPMTFQDLSSACSHSRRFAEEGFFFIHNEQAVKSLYLADYYKKFINKNTLENIITLPAEKIASMYKNTTNTLKDTIIDLIVKGIVANDPQYLDRTKIYKLSELIGVDIYRRSDSLIETKKEIQRNSKVK
jgi:hypothetical protein